MSEPTLADVIRRLDLIDTRLATIDLELRALRAQQIIFETRLDTLIDAVAAIARSLNEHMRDGHGG